MANGPYVHSEVRTATTTPRSEGRGLSNEVIAMDSRTGGRGAEVMPDLSR